MAVTISDSQWEEVLWDREEEERDELEKEKEKAKQQDALEDDIYVCGDEDIPIKQRGDWIGVDGRDRRSAFLIIGALKSEGIL